MLSNVDEEPRFVNEKQYKNKIKIQQNDDNESQKSKKISFKRNINEIIKKRNSKLK